MLRLGVFACLVGLVATLPALASTDCGDAPQPLSTTLKNVLLVGDSISMPMLGYGNDTRDMMDGLAAVQHNGGWGTGGQAGPTTKALECMDKWTGGLKWYCERFSVDKRRAGT